MSLFGALWRAAVAVIGFHVAAGVLVGWYALFGPIGLIAEVAITFFAMALLLKARAAEDGE